MFHKLRGALVLSFVFACALATALAANPLPDVEREGEAAVDHLAAAAAATVLCHFPPGNPSNPRTIVVGAAAVPAHLAHGDTLGACGDRNADCPAGQGSDCCEAHESAGCSDPGCEALICQTDPFCCQIAWEAQCVQRALIDPLCRSGCEGAGDALCLPDPGEWCVYDVTPDAVQPANHCCGPLVPGAAGKLCRRCKAPAIDENGICKVRPLGAITRWDISGPAGPFCCTGKYDAGGGVACEDCPEGAKKVIPTP